MQGLKVVPGPIEGRFYPRIEKDMYTTKLDMFLTARGEHERLWCFPIAEAGNNIELLGRGIVRAIEGFENKNGWYPITDGGRLPFPDLELSEWLAIWDKPEPHYRWKLEKRA